MNRSFTTIIGAAVVALLIVGAGLFGVIASKPTTIQAATTDQRRTITVVGNGTTKATPDTATVQVGVQTQAATAKEAMASNSGQMQALVEKLKTSGIAAKDIQTSNLSISPTYDDKGRAVTGYQVNNTVTVKIRDVSKASDLLDKVVEAGANNIYGISFGFDDPATLQATARNNAIADARSRAEAMAKASNATLGQVIVITEQLNSMPVPMPAMSAAAGAADARAMAPVEAGEQAVTAQVQMSFELK